MCQRLPSFGSHSSVLFRAVTTFCSSIGFGEHNLKPFEVIAHQGGWDEILVVAGPLLLFWWILVKTNRKVAGGNDETDTETNNTEPGDDSTE